MGNLGRSCERPIGTVWRQRRDRRVPFLRRGVTRSEQHFGRQNQPNPPSTAGPPLHSEALKVSHNALGYRRTLGNLGRSCEHPLGTVWRVRGPLRRALWARGAARPNQHFTLQNRSKPHISLFLPVHTRGILGRQNAPEAEKNLANLGRMRKTGVLREWRRSGTRAAAPDPPFGARPDGAGIAGNSGIIANRRSGTPSTVRPPHFP